jgi:hypothetical protein
MVIEMPRPTNGRSRREPPKPHVLQLRLTDVQRRYLLFLAAREERHMSDVVRGLIDRSLDRQPRVHDESELELPEDVRGDGMSLRSLLGMVDDSAIEDLADRHGA